MNEGAETDSVVFGRARNGTQFWHSRVFWVTVSLMSSFAWLISWQPQFRSTSTSYLSFISLFSFAVSYFTLLFCFPSSFLTIDRDGIRGTDLFSNNDQRLGWSRLNSVEIDGAAVVIRFDPLDINSRYPDDRVSVKRLTAGNVPPEDIERVIKSYWEASKAVSV